MYLNESKIRHEMADYSQRLWNKGWVANHDGNLSFRLNRGRIMCTPTGESKKAISSEMILTLNEDGKVISGKHRPFSELALHHAWYDARDDVKAVIHAHCPYASAIALTQKELPHPFLPEAVVSLGASIPTVPLTMPGQDALQAIEPYLCDHDALIVAGNGVFTAGENLEQAYLRMELVEHLATIAAHAKAMHEELPLLPAHYIPKLLDARKRAGLGPEARAERAKEEAKKKARFNSRSKNGEEKEENLNEGELNAIVQSEIDRVLKA